MLCHFAVRKAANSQRRSFEIERIRLPLSLSARRHTLRHALVFAVGHHVIIPRDFVGK
jgi:hypothetical protein